MSRLFPNQLGYRAIYILDSNRQAFASVELGHGNFEAGDDHTVLRGARRNLVAHEQRVVELLPEHRIKLKEPFGIHLGNRRTGMVVAGGPVTETSTVRTTKG
jgi:hypothetical protein